jgi:hypothetical protein
MWVLTVGRNDHPFRLRSFPYRQKGAKDHDNKFLFSDSG